jgi:hypothetical protein
MRRIVANLPAEARFEIHARIGVAAGRSSDLQARPLNRKYIASIKWRFY